MGRPGLLLPALLACAVASSAAAPAAGQPQPQLAALNPHALMGTWACSGADDARYALKARLFWGFNDGGAFYLTFDPEPLTATHARIAEVWEGDAAGGGRVWRAIPDPGSADPAQYTSSGWAGNTLTWIRMAAQSTAERVFTRTAPNRLTFRFERSVPDKGNAGDRKHIIYHVDCLRTVDDSPH